MKYLASPLPFDGPGQVCLTPLVLPAILLSLQLEPTARDSYKGSRRSLWLTAQRQELENLLQQFRTLQIGPDDSPLFRLVASIDACHNRSNLPEVSGLDLSPLPDDDFDLSAVNQSDWLSAPPFQSLSPELADTPTVASKEMPETETTSDTPFQENLADETNLSDFKESHLTSHFSSSLSSHSKSEVFVIFILKITLIIRFYFPIALLPS